MRFLHFFIAFAGFILVGANPVTNDARHELEGRDLASDILKKIEGAVDCTGCQV
jgi:hypothetical protein